MQSSRRGNRLFAQSSLPRGGGLAWGYPHGKAGSFAQVIDTASNDDFAAIAALNVAAYEEFSSHLAPGSWDVMRGNIQNIAERAKTAEFLVCREAGELVGSVAYCPAGKADPNVFPPGTAAIMLLAVHPRHRGRGLAKALMLDCMERARSDGAQAVALVTSELMASAQHIYRSLGLQLESELPPCHGVRYFRYVLPLAAPGVGG